jgi:hypothetical protein
MSQLSEAVEALRAHDAQLVGLLDDLMGELTTIQRSVSNIKKSLASQRSDAPGILDALETLERLEIDWASTTDMDEIHRRRRAVEVIRPAQRAYRTAHDYSAREDRDPVVAAIAQDIQDRVSELVEDLMPVFGLDPTRMDPLAIAREPDHPTHVHH